MKIPNEEISYIYKNNIREWFLQCIGKQDLSGLVKVFEEGDCETASDIIKSNRESGNGRYDLTLKTKRIRKAISFPVSICTVQITLILNNKTDNVYTFYKMV